MEGKITNKEGKTAKNGTPYYTVQINNKQYICFDTQELKGLNIGDTITFDIKKDNKGYERIYNVQQIDNTFEEFIETPTKQEKKQTNQQILIIRQNCLTNANKFHETTPNLTEEQVTKTAEIFEKWILRESNS